MATRTATLDCMPGHTARATTRAKHMATKEAKMAARVAKQVAQAQAAAEGKLTSAQIGAARLVPQVEDASQGRGYSAEGSMEEPAAEAEPVQPAPAAGPVLHVKQGLALRGGRGEWYKLLCKYDGKPVAEYVAEGKAKPASHYTARSTKCGQPKTPESRLSWFKRAGIVTIA